MSYDIKLKPCPFCGGTASINVRKKPWYCFNFVTVECDSFGECNVCPETDHHHFDGDEEEKEAVEAAVKAWNLRVKS